MSTLRRTGALERDGYRLVLLAELRMAEHHFVRPDRDRQVADRRLADAVAVDPDLGPRRRVEIDDALRQLERSAAPCRAAPGSTRSTR